MFGCACGMRLRQTGGLMHSVLGLMGLEVPVPDRSGQRDRHTMAIAERGRLKWQAATGYGKRALIETTIGRYKTLIGPRLRARCFPAPRLPSGCAVLNRALTSGGPESGRRQNRQS